MMPHNSKLCMNIGFDYRYLLSMNNYEEYSIAVGYFKCDGGEQDERASVCGRGGRL